MMMKIWTLLVFLAFMAIASGNVSFGQSAPDRGGAFRSLNPEQRRAVLQKIIQNRASRQQGSNSAGAGAGAKSNSKAVNSDQLTLKSDVHYGPSPLQCLDIYTPKSVAKNAATLPVVIFLHGGGWKRGDKAQGDRKDKGATYVANGIVFVSANYRLAPAVVHPKQIEDVASAFAWTKAHACEFGGDPSRIYLMGHSAGAHLVDLLGTNDRFLAAQGLSLKDISGVISLDTASLNLTERRSEKGFESDLVGPMIDNAFGREPQVLKDASPTLSIKSGTVYPPFLMFCGIKRIACVAQHKEFSQAMKKAGGQVTVKEVPLGHGEINRASGQADAEIFKDCMKFIKG